MNGRWRGGAVWPRSVSLVAVTALLACWSLTSAPATYARSEPKIQKGGVLKELAPVAPPTLDAAKTSSVATFGVFAEPIYGGLLFRETTSSNAEPWFAESVDSSADARTWTVKIRKGITFSDGTPYDAAAVKAHWDRVLNPATRSPLLSAASVIERVDVVDRLTVKATMKAPYALFGSLLEGALGWIPSPTAVNKYGDAFGSSPSTTVGAGPFVVTDWIRGSSVAYQRNPSYWDGPKPYFDKLEIGVLADSEQQYNTLLTGGTDVIGARSGGTYFGRALTQPSIRAVAIQPPPSQRYVFNVKKAPFSDERARRALSIAIDPKQFNAARYGGEGTIINSIYSEKSAWYDASLRIPKFDHAEAQRLFNAVARDTGKPVEITFLNNDVFAARGESDQMAAYLATYDNVKLTIRVAASSAFFDAMRAGDWDFTILGLTSTDEPTVGFETLRTGGTQNFTGVSDPKLDAAVQEAQAEPDVAKRKAAYRKAYREVLDSTLAFFVPVIDARSGWLFAKRVNGIRISTAGPRSDGLWASRS